MKTSRTIQNINKIYEKVDALNLSSEDEEKQDSFCSIKSDILSLLEELEQIATEEYEENEENQD